MVIEGEVTADWEIRVTLILIDKRGEHHEMPAIVDTGFTGFLTLPPEIITALDLTGDISGRVVLGDGSEQDLRRFQVRVWWQGKEVTIMA
jgi:predicted aspartyl protease